MPGGTMSVRRFTEGKGGTPLVCLAACTTPQARIADPHCDLVLVGDSLGMVMHGLPSTVGVTMEMMILHGQAVRRGLSSALMVVDMPFGSYGESPAQAFRNASRLMRETGCNAVKLEGGTAMAPTITFLVERGIPVMAHVGLVPQSWNMLGGYRLQGAGDDGERVLGDAGAVCAAGAFCIVLEKIPERLGARITRAVRVPTIGIGASPACDGQILVMDDLLGVFVKTPRFVRRYADFAGLADGAVAAWAADVRSRKFPDDSCVFPD